MAYEPGKDDQETTENEPKIVPVEGSDSLTHRLSSIVDAGDASEVLEDLTTLKNWEVSPFLLSSQGKQRIFGIWLGVFC